MSEESQPEPDDADLVANAIANLANLDQVFANVRDLARMIGVYYRNLLVSGFDVEQAFELTADYQAFVLAKGGGQDG